MHPNSLHLLAIAFVLVIIGLLVRAAIRANQRSVRLGHLCDFHRRRADDADIELDEAEKLLTREQRSTAYARAQMRIRQARIAELEGGVEVTIEAHYDPAPLRAARDELGHWAAAERARRLGLDPLLAADGRWPDPS